MNGCVEGVGCSFLVRMSKLCKADAYLMFFTCGVTGHVRNAKKPASTERRCCTCSEQLRQQVQWGKRGLSPPQEEDRKLPLQKLFDNLHEFEQTVPAPVSTLLLLSILSKGPL